MPKTTEVPQSVKDAVRAGMNAVYEAISPYDLSEEVIEQEWTALEEALFDLGFLDREPEAEQDPRGEDWVPEKAYEQMTSEERWNYYNWVMDVCDGYPITDLNPLCPEESCSSDLDPEGGCGRCGGRFPEAVPPLPKE